MKHLRLFIFFVVFSILTSCLSTAEEENINSNQVAIVRIYTSPKTDPYAFKRIPAVIENRIIHLKELGMLTENIAVCLQCDQNDPTVQDVVSNEIYVFTSKQEDFYFPTREQLIKSWTWTTKDAIGNTLPESDFDVFMWDAEGNRIFIEHIKSNGLFKSRKAPYLEYVFSNPDYGKARIRHICSSNVTHTDYYLPLVHSQSEAAGRAIAGRVLDSNGIPIENAQIYCRFVELPGGNSIKAQTWSDKIPVITDNTGNFRLYMPPDKSGIQMIGGLIPYNSAFSVRVEPPKNSTLLPYEGLLTNEKDLEIVLEKKSGNKHKFLFMTDANIPVDPNIVSYAAIRIERPGKNVLNLTYKQLSELQQVPYGTYNIEISPWPIVFYPVKITADSPEIVIFRLIEPVTYKGRIINGITGKLMPGVFVFVSNYENQSDRLTQEDWSRLHNLVSEPNLQEIRKILTKVYSLSKFAITGIDGSYKISGNSVSYPEKIYAIEENFMPCMIMTNNMQPTSGSTAEIKDIKLYPEATVEADFCGTGNILVKPGWKFADKNIPEWATNLKNEFVSKKWNKTIESGITRNNWSIYVPANINIEISYKPSFEDENRYGVCNVKKIIHLSQGQNLHLGELVMPPIESVNVKVSLKVLDAKGNPLEGVPVRIGGDIAHTTDVNGIAYFYVDKNTKSRFWVSCKDPLHRRKNKEYSLDFSLADTNNDSNDFEIRVSDEFVNCIYDEI